nr:transposase [Paraburkholderia phenoliruptrix]
MFEIHRSKSERKARIIPGIGPVVATALFSGVGDPSQFKNGRQFAAWLDLTPKQRSSVGKSKLNATIKHGDTYLRTLLGTRCACGDAFREPPRRPA